MKKKSLKVKEIILTVIFLPIVILFLLGLLIITPFDYLKYKKSRYYKDTKEKYSWLCTSSYYIKFYDLIKKADLPIDYYRCDYVPITGYGFFVYKDMLILNDYEPCFDEEKNIYDYKMFVQELELAFESFLPKISSPFKVELISGGIIISLNFNTSFSK